MRRPSEIGAAVIGSGFIGTVHVEALRRLGVKVHGVLGTSAERATTRAQQLGVERGYASLEDLLADDRVEAGTSLPRTTCTTRRFARSSPPGATWCARSRSP